MKTLLKLFLMVGLLTLAAPALNAATYDTTGRTTNRVGITDEVLGFCPTCPSGSQMIEVNWSNILHSLTGFAHWPTAGSGEVSTAQLLVVSNIVITLSNAYYSAWGSLSSNAITAKLDSNIWWAAWGSLSSNAITAKLDSNVWAAAWGALSTNALSGKLGSNAMIGQFHGLTDPNADRIIFWDDSAGTITYLTAGTGLNISGTTINATSSGSGTMNTLKENGTQVGDSDIATLDFLGVDFDLTESPDTEVNVVIAAAITRDAEWDTAAEINTATTDDDFLTLTGSQSVTGTKTFTGPLIFSFQKSGNGNFGSATTNGGTIATNASFALTLPTSPTHGQRFYLMVSNHAPAANIIGTNALGIYDFTVRSNVNELHYSSNSITFQTLFYLTNFSGVGQWYLESSSGFSYALVAGSFMTWSTNVDIVTMNVTGVQPTNAVLTALQGNPNVTTNILSGGGPIIVTSNNAGVFTITSTAQPTNTALTFLGNVDTNAFFQRKATNYAHATSIAINCGTDVAANITNSTSADVSVLLTNVVPNTSGRISITSDGSARTFNLFSGISITMLSTNETLNSTQIVTTASKRMLINWAATLETPTKTNLLVWAKSAP